MAGWTIEDDLTAPLDATGARWRTRALAAEQLLSDLLGASDQWEAEVVARKARAHLNLPAPTPGGEEQ